MTGSSIDATRLRLISYLSPSIPAGFYAAVAQIVRDATGYTVELRFDERNSGPLPGDENPFLNGRADIGFVCAPAYKWCREYLELLPVPLPTDSRAQGRAVYFADIAVRDGSGINNLAELRGRRWAFNDHNSLSGWFSIVDYIAPEHPHEYFSALCHAGSHLRSLQLLSDGAVDAAGIDSNAWLYHRQQERYPGIRVIDSLGPFPIQPVVMRTALPDEVKDAVRRALLNAHHRIGMQMREFGYHRFVEAEATAYL